MRRGFSIRIGVYQIDDRGACSQIAGRGFNGCDPALSVDIPSGAFAHGQIDLTALYDFIAECRVEECDVIIRHTSGVALIVIYNSGVAIIVGTAEPGTAVSKIEVQLAAIGCQCIPRQIKPAVIGILYIDKSAISGYDIAGNEAVQGAIIGIIIFNGYMTA